MLGSYHDAADAVQETLLRAWRHLESFQGRSSFRSWLYRIATNVCLSERSRRPPVEPTVASAAEHIPHTLGPVVALSPYPDVLLDELAAAGASPAAAYDLHESVQLAFLAAVQVLPPRERAALILRDLARFSAEEKAELLESTVASANSALRRVRGTLEQQRAAGRLHLDRAPTSDATCEAIVHRYVKAWQTRDIDQLVDLLKQDVVMTMPPLPMHYSGRRDVIDFLTSIPAQSERALFHFVPTRANRQRAIAVYRRAANRVFQAWPLFVLSADRDSVAEITAFIDASLILIFGMPVELAEPSDLG
ncbi:MAG: RNA polymerase subunit sigma-70 [Chloroflexi bacterium]|nr:RNA polymerase subunit sigma-70 [Chloroflexota bacterium]